MFSGAASGVYVEQGWKNLEHLSKKTENSNETSAVKEVTMETEENKVVPIEDDDVELVEVAKDESKMGVNENKAQELKYTATNEQLLESPTVVFFIKLPC